MDFVTHAAPLPQQLPKFLALIYPFDQYVWALVFISFVLYCFVFYLFCKYLKVPYSWNNKPRFSITIRQADPQINEKHFISMSFFEIRHY